jgi:hypothetical protein
MAEVDRGRLIPVFEVSPPLAGTILRMLRGDKAREDRPRLMARNDIDDRRKHPLHPGRFPQAAGREDILHTNAEIDGVVYLGDLRHTLSHRSPPGDILDSVFAPGIGTWEVTKRSKVAIIEGDIEYGPFHQGH